VCVRATTNAALKDLRLITPNADRRVDSLFATLHFHHRRRQLWWPRQLWSHWHVTMWQPSCESTIRRWSELWWKNNQVCGPNFAIFHAPRNRTVIIWHNMTIIYYRKSQHCCLKSHTPLYRRRQQTENSAHILSSTTVQQIYDDTLTDNFQEFDLVIRPPGTVVPGRPYVLLQFFFFNA